MKKLIVICLVGLLSCDPPRISPYALNYVFLDAVVSPYQTTFYLGDTLKLRTYIPDSLEYDYFEGDLPKTSKIFIQSIDNINGVYAIVYKFDTLNGGLTSYKDDDLNFKYEETYFNFQKRPFYVELKIIPKTKGVFYTEFRSTPNTKIKANNNFEARISVKYKEGLNLNTDMYCKYTVAGGTINDIGRCLSEMNNQRRAYTFKVE